MGGRVLPAAALLDDSDLPGLDSQGGDVAGDDFEVLEAGFLGLAVDVLFLGARVGEGGDLAVGEDFGEVEAQGALAAAI